MSDNEVAMPAEIVIIRRRSGGEDDGHHGGAWKIAYADFMTAMMAFFLVMWLISISDKKTVTEIATYFNPIKLADRKAAPKGVHDLDEDAVTPSKEAEKPKKESKTKEKPKEAGSKEGTGPAKAEPKAKSATEGKAAAAKPDPAAKPVDGKAVFSDEELFADPYGVLAKLAMQATERSNARGKEAPGPEGIAARPAGEAFRDPFDPNSWKDVEARPDPSSARARRAGSEKKESPASEPKAATSPVPAAAAKPGVAAETATESATVEAEIRKALGDTRPGTTPNIEVQATPEGILISLTDEFDFGMFAVASAEPRPELIPVMDKLAKVVGAHAGRIIVRGHTDGRPFKSGAYDNWRLSSARAHMAYHMLVRGGVDTARFERLEGYGERSLKVQGDPLAAQNRRIEILLRKGTT